MLLYITPFNQHWHHRNIGITVRKKTTQSGWIEINYLKERHCISFGRGLQHFEKKKRKTTVHLHLHSSKHSKRKKPI